jgi:hypothetical protein
MSELPYRVADVLVPKIVRSVFDAVTAERGLDEVLRHLSAAKGESVHRRGVSDAAFRQPFCL